MKLFIDRLRKFYDYKDLFAILVQRDIKMRYRRSVLGYVWSVLSPLLTMTVMTLVFSQMFVRDIKNFPAYLICGQILFGYMTESTNGAMASVSGNGALLKKTYVPKYIFTMATVTSSLVNMLFSFGALLIVFIATGVHFTPYALLWFLPVIQLYFFCLGLGLFLAQASVFFKDIKYIYSVFTMAWMYLTPIFYEITQLPEWLGTAMQRFNPMYIYIYQMRCFLYEGTMVYPSFIFRGFLLAAVMLALGLWSFGRNKDKFILYI